jgi:hypothetical protein
MRESLAVSTAGLVCRPSPQHPHSPPPHLDLLPVVSARTSPCGGRAEPSDTLIDRYSRRCPRLARCPPDAPSLHLAYPGDLEPFAVARRVLHWMRIRSQTSRNRLPTALDCPVWAHSYRRRKCSPLRKSIRPAPGLACLHLRLASSRRWLSRSATRLSSRAERVGMLCRGRGRGPLLFWRAVRRLRDRAG